MPRPEDPIELALVIKAIVSGLSDCVEWQDDRLVNRVRNDPDMGRLRPQHIKSDLVEAVKECPELVIQVREQRPEYQPFRAFWYKVILHYEEIPNDFFVELILNDINPELPAITIVNVHPQRRNE